MPHPTPRHGKPPAFPVRSVERRPNDKHRDNRPRPNVPDSGLPRPNSKDALPSRNASPATAPPACGIAQTRRVVPTSQTVTAIRNTTATARPPPPNDAHDDASPRNAPTLRHFHVAVPRPRRHRTQTLNVRDVDVVTTTRPVGLAAIPVTSPSNGSGAVRTSSCRPSPGAGRTGGASHGTRPPSGRRTQQTTHRRPRTQRAAAPCPQATARPASTQQSSHGRRPHARRSGPSGGRRPAASGSDRAAQEARTAKKRPSARQRQGLR